MAGSAQIGALRVSLGLDTAQFSSGVAAAQSQLSRLGGIIKGFAAGALAALSVDKVVGTIQASINSMDALAQASQKIGIPVDELSKLSYAAQLADVPLADLTASVAKFSKSLAEIAGGGKNNAGIAMRAIGVSALDATGKVRPMGDVIADVAGKFATYDDGAQKTAIAMALFGKSGADMIPLLNGGRDAIVAAGAELERFGGVVTPEAARQADEFNDSLDKVREIGKSFVLHITEDMLPALQSTVDAFIDLAGTDEKVKVFADNVSGYFAATSKRVQEFGNAVLTAGAIFSGVTDILGNLSSNDDTLAAIERMSNNISGIWGQIDEHAKDFSQSLKTISGPGKQSITNSAGNLPLGSAPTIDWHAIQKAEEAARKARQELEKLKAEGLSVFEQTRTPLEQYQLGVTRLSELLRRGVIDQDTYNRAVSQLKTTMNAAGKEVWDSTRTKLEQYIEKLKDLNKLYADHSIDPETYARAVRNLKNEFAPAAKAANDLGKEMQSAFGTEIRSWIDDLIDGTFNLQDALAGVLKRLASIALDDVFARLFSGGNTAPSQSGGGLFGLIGNLIGGLFGESARAPAAKLPTPSEAAHLGGASKLVLEYRNAPPQVEQRRGADGNLELVVREMVSNDIASGRHDNAMMRFGLRPSPKVR